MLLLYVFLVHILGIIGLYFLWDPSYLPLIIIGNIFFGLIGGEIFYHRYLSHNSFTCSNAVKYFMIFCSFFSGQGGPLGWCMHHREHHKYSDTDKDPHTVDEDPIGMWFCPNNRRGLWIGPEGNWDLLDQDLLQFIQRWFWYIHFVLLLTVIAIDIKIAFYLILLPNLLGVHQQGMINVLGHRWGYRSYNTPDHSVNNRILALFTFGDCLQNNHHAFPWSYNNAVGPGEFDISAVVIKHILAKSVVEPNASEFLCSNK